MLTIRNAQMAALRHASRDHFLGQLGVHLAHYFPADVRVLDAAQLSAVMELGIGRAAEYGLALAGQTAHFVSLMFMLGSHFDQDPQLPWAAAALNAPGTQAGARLQQLHAAAKSHLHAISGPTGAIYRAALVTARRLPFEAFQADRLSDDAIRAIATRIHPEKYHRIPDIAAVLALAHAKAAQHGLPAGGDGALCGATLMLLLGSHFDRDPIHPWAAEVLARDLPPGAKSLALHQQALTRLERYFSHSSSAET